MGKLTSVSKTLPSSILPLLRHATELRKILQLNNVQPILLTYTGGSPDQRPYFLSVQLALLSLFLDLDLITFCAVHTIFL